MVAGGINFLAALALPPVQTGLEQIFVQILGRGMAFPQQLQNGLAATNKINKDKLILGIAASTYLNMDPITRPWIPNSWTKIWFVLQTSWWEQFKGSLPSWMCPITFWPNMQMFTSARESLVKVLIPGRGKFGGKFSPLRFLLPVPIPQRGPKEPHAFYVLHTFMPVIQLSYGA